LTVAKHCAYWIAAAAICSAIVASVSMAAPPRIYSLKVGDRFDVAGTHINCNIGAASTGRAPTVTCRLLRPATENALPKSYAFSFGDRGVDVLGPAPEQRVVFHAGTDAGLPLGDPAPPDRSSGRTNAHLRPVAQGLEGVNVARTSVICVAVAYPRPHGPSLNCTLSSRAITKALSKPRLAFRPLTVTFSPQLLRVWRMSKTKTQRVVFSRSQPKS